MCVYMPSTHHTSNIFLAQGLDKENVVCFIYIYIYITLQYSVVLYLSTSALIGGSSPKILTLTKILVAHVEIEHGLL